jgi:FkbM family methyltransferase
MREEITGKIRLPVIHKTLIMTGLRNDKVFVSYYKNSIYDDKVVRTIKDIISDDSYCLDIGANIGFISIALSCIAPLGIIWSFEPSAKAYRFLLKNISDNSIKNVKPYNTALGANNTIVIFCEVPTSTAWSHMLSCDFYRESGLRYEEAQGVKTKCQTLDNWSSKNNIDRIDFMKIDVEGAELDVLRGSATILKNFRPLVILEFNSHCIVNFRNITPRAFLNELFDIFDYVYIIDRSSGRLKSIQNDPHDKTKFLLSNFLGGFVDNLVCCFKKSRFLERAISIEEAARIVEN